VPSPPTQLRNPTLILTHPHPHFTLTSRPPHPHFTLAFGLALLPSCPPQLRRASPSSPLARHSYERPRPPPLLPATATRPRRLCARCARSSVPSVCRTSSYPPHAARPTATASCNAPACSSRCARDGTRLDLTARRACSSSCARRHGTCWCRTRAHAAAIPTSPRTSHSARSAPHAASGCMDAWRAGRRMGQRRLSGIGGGWHGAVGVVLRCQVWPRASWAGAVFGRPEHGRRAV
jgi:hypothetical protein